MVLVNVKLPSKLDLLAGKPVGSLICFEDERIRLVGSSEFKNKVN